MCVCVFTGGVCVCLCLRGGVCARAPVHSRPSELTNDVHASCFLCAATVDADEGFLALLLPLAPRWQRCRERGGESQTLFISGPFQAGSDLSEISDTSGPGCVIYVLPRQIARQGTERQPFLPPRL